MDQAKVKKWTEQITSLLKWVATSHNALSMWEKKKERGEVSSEELESNILKDDIRRRHQALQKLVLDYQVEMEKVLNTSLVTGGYTPEMTILENVSKTIVDSQAQMDEAEAELKNAQEERRKKTPINYSGVGDHVNGRVNERVLSQELSISSTHSPSISTQKASSSANPVPTTAPTPKPPEKRGKVTLSAKSGNGKSSAAATAAVCGSGAHSAKKQKAGSRTKVNKAASSVAGRNIKN